MIIFAALILGGIAYSIFSLQSTKKIFEKIGSDFNLQATKNGFFKYPELRGRIKNLAFNIEYITEGGGEDSTTYLSASAGFYHPHDLSFKISSTGSRKPILNKVFDKIGRLFKKNTVKTGIKDFDKKYLITSVYNHEIQAFLDTQFRQMVRQFDTITHEFTISDAKISCRLHMPIRKLEKNLASFITLCGQIHDHLLRDTPLNERLMKIIKNDPSDDVRNNALLSLTALYPEENETITFLRPMLSSDDSWFRLEAAYGIGGTTREEYIIQDLGSEEPERVNHALLTAAKSKSGTLIHSLKNIYDRFDKNIDNIALVTALGACGNLETIEDLYNLKVNPVDVKLKKCVTKAIADIQSRYVKGEKGQVSIAETNDTTGHLSIKNNQ